MQQRGQALLIIILIIVVSMTVGLSVASRSITNLRLSTEEENSQRAFSAAESGIEQVLTTGQKITQAVTLNKQTKIESASVTIIEGNEFFVNNSNPVVKSDGADIWLIAHNGDGTPDYPSAQQNLKLDVHWGLTNVTGDCNNAALEVVTIVDYGSEKSVREVFDPCTIRRSGNGFSPASSGIGSSICRDLPYEANLAKIDGGILMRVIPHYANAIICVEVQGNKLLPSQGRLIDAVGSSGDTTRKVTFFQGFPRLPVEFFPYIQLVP